MSAFVIAGLVLGGIYAISALGLVLTYNASRIFNFAHGGIAYVVALGFYELDTNRGWPTGVAALVAIGVIGPGLGLVLWASLFRHMSDAPVVIQVGVTVGLAVALPAIAQFVFTDEQVFRAPGLAGDPPPIHRILGVNLNADQLIVMVSAVAVAIAVTLVLRYTGFGLSIRTVVDQRELSQVVGTNAAAVSAATWALGAGLAGFAGVLVAPLIGLSPPISFLLLVTASFAAAVAGRLTSLPLTFLGAIALGVVQGVAVRWLPSSGLLSRGFRPSIPFVFLVLALLVRWWTSDSERRTATDRPLVQRDPSLLPVDASRLVRWGAAMVFVAALVVVPFFLEFVWVTNLALAAALATVFLSIVVVTGEGGVVSLCQVTFAGIGAVVTAQLATELGWPLLPSVLAGGLTAVPFGLLIAVPALRLGGLYLALATLAFALLMDNLVFQLDRFSQTGLGVSVDRPVLFGYEIDTDLRLYFGFLAVFAVLAALVGTLRRATVGLRMSAVRTSEPAAAMTGIGLLRARLGVFGLGAFVAGIGGGLVAVYQGRADPVSFSALVGLVWFSVVVAFGVRSVPGSLVAALAYALTPVFFDRHLPDWATTLLPAFFGLAAVAAALEPRGIVALTVDGIRRGARATRRLLVRPVDDAATVV